MQEIAQRGVVDILGIDWQYFNSTNRTLNDYGKSSLSKLAHQSGMLIQPFAAKDDFIKFGFTHPFEEYSFYWREGVDGIFTEFPKTAKLSFDLLFSQEYEKLETCTVCSIK